METEDEWCERIAKTIDPDETFLDECEDAVKFMKCRKNTKGEKNG